MIRPHISVIDEDSMINKLLVGQGVMFTHYSLRYAAMRFFTKFSASHKYSAMKL